MSMTRERIYLFDTTLRDGQQTPGIDFNVEDKIAIAQMLDEFGLDYVEGGYPGANPTDTAFFERKRTSAAKFVAFGMTKRAGISVSNDPGIAALNGSKSDAVCYVAKSWDLHVRVALGCTNEENLESISQSVEATTTFRSPVRMSMVKISMGTPAASRAAIHCDLAWAKVRGRPSGPVPL